MTARAGELQMKKVLMLAGIAMVSMLAMGLASRDSQPASARHDGEALTYEAHLRYYEQIRPALVRGGDAVHALCSGERAETQRAAE